MGEPTEKTEAAGTDLPALDAFQRWTHLTGRAQQLMLEWWSRQEPGTMAADPLGLWDSWSKLATAAAGDPARLVKLQTDYVADSLKLWSGLLTGHADETPVPTAKADKDRRFGSEAWRENPVFDLVRRSYLLTSQYMMETAAGTQGLSEEDKRKALFHVRQFIDAMSPSNFAATNPEVLARAAETNGESLVRGIEHLLADLERGKLTMTDEAAFEVGRNVAATPGSVVFENRLFQLIQYKPTTGTVAEVPLLIFPPWINKFYILDLTPEKSFIKWAVDQGLTVFVVSWKNPDATLADVTLDSYVIEGQVRAVEEACRAAGADRVHAIGYCVAGTVLAATMAFLKAKGEGNKIASATFFTAQVDFSEAGDLLAFVDDAQLETIEKLSGGKGYLDGRYMATTFNMLRSNDLIWSTVVNNYMLGKDYVPFDLLYWNSDATNVPAKWHGAYLRDMYRDNKLCRPGGISVDGVPVDIGTIDVPAFVQAGKEDHIAPARSAWKLAKLLRGPTRFVLAGSGHIAGVVNPPAANKYQHWTLDGPLPESFDEFVGAARETKGSWWPDWIAWLKPLSGGQVPAREPAHEIEPAPGRYVKERI